MLSGLLSRLLTRLLTRLLSWWLNWGLNWLYWLRGRVRDRYDDFIEVGITCSITNAHSNCAGSWTSREHAGGVIDSATKGITAD